jgi:hypothetical protein
MKRIVVLPAAFLATALGADLPVRGVVLYKHGVGYFERAGELRAGEAARLNFKPSEMNDVLKSLTIEERNGGMISGVRYDSSEPLTKKLSEFPFRLGERQPLSALLDSVKGARVEVRFGPETIRGAIVSGRLAAAGEQRPEKEQLTLLLDSGDLRTLDLSGAANIRFQDPELQSQLRDYLAALTGARSREKRSVYIDSSDVKRRHIVAGYVIPTPVWKSSYRLIFGNTGDPTLEGWAIVDNVTGEDWTNVRLSLVSGRPISFISKLYEPRYLRRPTAELPEERPKGPTIHAGALEEQKREREVRDVRKQVAMRAMVAAEMVAPSPAPSERAQIASSIVSAAQSRELGELFEYNFPTAVTVRKSESAMLPFLQQKIGAHKLLIYADQASQHPMNAVEIMNNTGKTLDGGPVTVFDANAYAGEALMETLKTSDRRLISYAVDLGTRITTRFDSGREMIREVHFRRGVLTTRKALQQTRTYTIRNVDQKPKTLIVEHPARPDYKLVNRKADETTASAYRFEVKLASGATEKLPVVEEKVYETSLAVTNLTPDVLASYVQNKELSDDARKQLESILQQKRLIAETDRALGLTQQEFKDLSQDQQRLRQNISSLNRVSGQQEQVQKYARQLAIQETQLAALRDRLAELRKKKAALESELNSLIEKMEF